MRNAAKITVIIPTYNRSKDLKRALESVFNQTYQADEIIVVDDNSTDNTSDMLKEYADRIVYLKHKANSGASAGRNTGINQASGDFVAFLDSDDIWDEHKLERQVEFMKVNAFEVSVTGFAVGYQGSRGVEIKNRPYKEITTEDCLWGVYTAPGSTMICNTHLIKEIEGYNTNYKRLEDWELFFKLTNRTKIGFLNENLAFISPSGGPAVSIIKESCDLLLRDAPSLLGDNYNKYIEKLRAGIDFEFAVVCWKAGNYVRSFRYFVTSYFYSPYNHKSFKIILYPAIKKRLFNIDN